MPQSPRREQIMAAAAHRFAQRGFHATTMDDISREANVSAGLIYRHFESKSQLVLALAEQYEQEMLQSLALMQAAPTLLDALRAVFTFTLNAQIQPQDGALAIEVMAEALRNPQVAIVLRRADDALSAGLAALIVAAQQRGEVDPDLAADLAAEVLLSLDNGLLLRYGLSEAATEQTISQMRDLLLVLCRRFLHMSAGDQ